MTYKEKIQQVIDRYQFYKELHELPNDYPGEYNQGVVKCCNNVINDLKKIL